MAYTTDDMVTEIKQVSFLPAAQLQFTPAKILAIADRMVLRRVVPAFMGIRHGYYRETVDIPLVAAQASYDVPRYAMNNKVHLLRLVAPDGATIGPLLYKDPIDLDYSNSATQGTPYTIRFDADQITLNSTPNAGALVQWPAMRAWIYRRPGRMVPTASAAQVASVVGTTVTYSATKPTTFTATSVHDFYRGNSPFRRVGSAVTSTGSPLGTTQTFGAADAALLAAGDWVCLRDETVFPPCAIEIVPFLEELVIASMARTQKDNEAYETSMKEIMDDMMTNVSASANRAEAMPQVQSLMHSPFVRAVGRRGMRSTRS